jgi:hypothetical protein
MKLFNSKRLTFRLNLCLVFLLAIFIIHSCKKENKFSQLSLTDSVNQAKRWYETTYPVNTSINSKLTATQSINTASNSGVDYSQLIKPDWAHAANYKRFNKAVIEMPVDPSAAMTFSLKNKTTGQTVYSKENSKTSFILLNDGKGYTAYMMTILADPSYLGNDHSKLANNTFRKHDADFTGMVFYFTPKGKFVRSYAYKQGKIITPATTAAQTTQSVNSKKKVTELAACIDWYWSTWDSDGDLVSETYLYTTCSGGGSGGGGGSPAPVCTAPSTNSITSSHLSVNVASPPLDDGSGDDGGYPDPTPEPCPVDVPNIIDSVKNPCLKGMVDSILSTNVKGKIDSMIQVVFGGSQTLDLTFTDQIAMDVSTDDGEEKGRFDPNNPSVLTSASIRLNATVLATSSREYIAAVIMHEALHAYLDSKGIAIGDAQHEQMAANYVNTMANDLMAMFPGLIKDAAYALAWGGLEGTALYSDPNKTVYLPTTQSAINTLYRFHTDGNGHFYGHGC